MSSPFSIWEYSTTPSLSFAPKPVLNHVLFTSFSTTYIDKLPALTMALCNLLQACLLPYGVHNHQTFLLQSPQSPDFSPQSPQPPHFSPKESTITRLLPHRVHNHHTSLLQSPQPPHFSPSEPTTTTLLPCCSSVSAFQHSSCSSVSAFQHSSCSSVPHGPLWGSGCPTQNANCALINFISTCVFCYAINKLHMFNIETYQFQST